MAVTIYYENDVNPEVIKGKKVAIIGYGSQGHAHALNLMDSGVDVRVGLREGSKSWAKAEEAGLKVMLEDEAAEEADVIMILIPDELQPEVYEQHIAPHLHAGDTLAFAHGFNIHYGYIKAPEDVNVIMCAPKGPATLCAVSSPRALACLTSHASLRTLLAMRGISPCPIAGASAVPFRHHQGDFRAGDRGRSLRRAGCSLRRPR